MGEFVQLIVHNILQLNFYTSFIVHTTHSHRSFTPTPEKRGIEYKTMGGCKAARQASDLLHLLRIYQQLVYKLFCTNLSYAHLHLYRLAIWSLYLRATWSLRIFKVGVIRPFSICSLMKPIL